MMYIVKLTRVAGQTRITLPKAFCEEHKLDEVVHVVINDEDPNNITIGRLEHDKAQAGDREGS